MNIHFSLNYTFDKFFDIDLELKSSLNLLSLVK